MNSPSARQHLRRELRQRRQSIPPRTRARRARQLARRLHCFAPLRHARHVAAYSAMGSEISLQDWLSTSPPHRQVYLPRVRGSRLDFLPHSAQQQCNRYGIAEPRSGRPRPAWALSVMLLPLLGFDRSGNRLGQGGGYYDRCLARLRWRRPWLIGVAYDEQACETLPIEAWDQPLDGVITPTQTLIFRK